MAENPETPRPAAPKPSIRTMKSDLESLLREKKPGVTDIISQEVARGTFRSGGQPSGARRFMPVAGIAFILAALGAGIFFFFVNTRTDQPIPQAPTAQAPVFFRPDSTRAISADTTDQASLLRLLDEISRESATDGAIIHVSVEVRDGPQPKRPLRTRDLVEFAGLGLPETIVRSLDSLPMLFVYYAQGRGSLGIALEPPRAERAFSELLSAEASLGSWLRPLLGDRRIEAAPEPFRDITWQNIDFRFQRLSADEDAGIAYGLFPGRQLLVIATSRGGFQAAIDRLFEAR